MAKIIGMGNNTPPKQPQQPKIDLNKSKPMVCNHCGYDVFLPAVKFRTISKIITGTPQDVMIPVDVYCCGECGAVKEELIPVEIRNLDNEK
jgi:DNA-directed RNA polymerase subunit RPC12/RpoP|tara:strand:+ start:14058 stop:14330 length:273 start_codon:yes stop_codon:yes gene_type:complete